MIKKILVLLLLLTVTTSCYAAKYVRGYTQKMALMYQDITEATLILPN